MHRRGRHLQFAGQIRQKPLAAAKHAFGGQRMRPRPTPSTLSQEAGDHAHRKALRSFGRMKALLIQAMGHLCHCLALSSQFLDPRTQIPVVRQLLVGLHRAHQRMTTDETTRSVDGDLDFVRHATHD